MGIVINKPLDIDLGEIFEQMDIPRRESGDQEQDHLSLAAQSIPTAVLSCTKQITEWDSSIIVSDELCVTTSKDILEAIAAGDGPAESLIALRLRRVGRWPTRTGN